MVIDVKYRTYITLIIALIIDQLSKFLVIKYIALNHSISIIDNFFKLIYIRNTGAAWGMFDDKTIVIAILSAVFLFFLIKFIEEEKNMDKFLQFCYGVLLGGIIGNLLDRLLRGYVVDFLSFKIFNYNYPIFNIADVFIVVSIILIVLFYFVGWCKNGKKG